MTPKEIEDFKEAYPEAYSIIEKRIAGEWNPLLDSGKYSTEAEAQMFFSAKLLAEVMPILVPTGSPPYAAFHEFSIAEDFIGCMLDPEEIDEWGEYIVNKDIEFSHTPNGSTKEVSETIVKGQTGQGSKDGVSFKPISFEEEVTLSWSIVNKLGEEYISEKKNPA